jgi:uncharacterized protein (TIGR02145 family)
MSTVYNYLRDGGMIIRIKPTVTSCNTLKVFPTFDVGLKHLLTVANGTGTGRYTGNELIQIIANSVNNYYFDHWTDPSLVVTDVNAGTTTVTMPFLDCTVTAVILPYRTLTVNNGSGSNTLLKPGDVRQIVANAPTQNYLFDNWTGDTAYLSANTSTANITMPNANIILTANYKPQFVTVNYGYLYNGHVVTDARNVAPIGWHVPTDVEWAALATYLGGAAVAGGKLKEVGYTHWSSPNSGATNETGFSSVSSGHRNYLGDFQSKGQGAIYWTSTPYYGYLYINMLQNTSNALSLNNTNYRESAFGIRFIKDDSNDTGFMTAPDGNTYHSVKIGTQVWTSSEYKGTKFRDGSDIPILNVDRTTWGARVTAAACAYNNDASDI